MDGDRGRQRPTPNPRERSLKRSASDSSIRYSNSRQLLDDLESESSTPVGLVTEEFSSMLVAATSAGGLLPRFLGQRTDPPNQHDDLLAPRPRGQHYGGSSSINTDQVGQENLDLWESEDSPPLWQPDLIRNNPNDHVLIFLDPSSRQSGSGTGIIPQVNDPRLSSRLAWEVQDETAGVQGSTSRIQFREVRALGEGVGDVNRGLSQEVITERLRQRKYNRLAASPKFGEESCCICQEGYADDEDVGKLDCEHEYHVACIRQWLEQKNACPICKKPALSRAI